MNTKKILSIFYVSFITYIFLNLSLTGFSGYKLNSGWAPISQSTGCLVNGEKTETEFPFVHEVGFTHECLGKSINLTALLANQVVYLFISVATGVLIVKVIFDRKPKRS